MVSSSLHIYAMCHVPRAVQGALLFEWPLSAYGLNIDIYSVDTVYRSLVGGGGDKNVKVRWLSTYCLLGHAKSSKKSGRHDTGTDRYTKQERRESY
jgi:hypothetical protein